MRTWWRWHRRIGLALGPALAFYAVSGLAINHPSWFPERTRSEHSWIDWPGGASGPRPDAVISRATAEGLARRVGLRGRALAPRRRADGGWVLAFVRPGVRAEIVWKPGSGRAELRRSVAFPRTWLRTLHGLARSGGGFPFRLWSLGLDAVAVGLIVLAASGVALWWRFRRDRVGAILLAASSLYVLGSLVYLLRAP